MIDKRSKRNINKSNQYNFRENNKNGRKIDG